MASSAQVHEQLQGLDGVMVGRQAYHQPGWLATWDAEFFGEPARGLDLDQVEEAMVVYMQAQALRGVAWPTVARHMLGLRHGQKGARKWRQVWSDHRLKGEPPQQVMRLARAAMQAVVTD